MEINLNNRTINFRKWKVKDRNNFVKATNDIERRYALVYNCLEDPNTPLDMEEYNYMLLMIRSLSLTPILTYTLKCVNPNCGKIYTTNVDISENLKNIKPCPYNDIVIDNIKIKIQRIKNQKAYEEHINSTTSPFTRYLMDFCLHIKSINDSEILTLDDVFNFMNELDVDAFEGIMTQWEDQRFKVDMKGYIECPHCHENVLYSFDDLPDFFPKSWKI